MVYLNFPHLCTEAITFFSLENCTHDNKAKPKSIMDFCSHYKNVYGHKNIPQPNIVSNVLDKMVSQGRLSLHYKGGMDNIDSKYISIIRDKNFVNNLENVHFKNQISIILNMAIFGFDAIYEYYKDVVLPIQHTTKSDNISLGTCFNSQIGIITARHCIEGSKELSIKGISKTLLNNSKILVHKNPLLDVAIIKADIGFPFAPSFESPRVLQNILTLGFPIIPGYQNFLAAEKATISSRFTASKGNISAIAEDIWLKKELMLLTARIRGGNSGGPIINDQGAVVGVAVNSPHFDRESNKYDDMGYGVAVSADLILNELEQGNFIELTEKLNFTDFE